MTAFFFYLKILAFPGEQNLHFLRISQRNQSHGASGQFHYACNLVDIDLLLLLLLFVVVLHGKMVFNS